MNLELCTAVKQGSLSECQADSSAVPGAEDGKLKAAGYKGGPASLYYMKQTISNACGTIGVLHAIGNNSDRANLGAVKLEQPLRACAASCDTSLICFYCKAALYGLCVTNSLLPPETEHFVQRTARSFSASSARHRACRLRSAAGTWRTRRPMRLTWTRRTTCGPVLHCSAALCMLYPHPSTRNGFICF